MELKISRICGFKDEESYIKAIVELEAMDQSGEIQNITLSFSERTASLMIQELTKVFPDEGRYAAVETAKIWA